MSKKHNKKDTNTSTTTFSGTVTAGAIHTGAGDVKIDGQTFNMFSPTKPKKNNLRKKLEQIDIESIYILCYDYFPIVYKQLSHGLGKLKIIDLLIKYAEKNSQIQVLSNFITKHS